VLRLSRETNRERGAGRLRREGDQKGQQLLRIPAVSRVGAGVEFSKLFIQLFYLRRVRKYKAINTYRSHIGNVKRL